MMPASMTGRAHNLGLLAGLAIVFVAVLSLLGSTSARAAEGCSATSLYVAAHQDDTLLFQSPNLIGDVQSNHCVRTIFVTAGDDGKEQPYWLGREEGAQAAYAQMAGVANRRRPPGPRRDPDREALDLDLLPAAPRRRHRRRRQPPLRRQEPAEALEQRPAR
jgi:hypothetical protein